MDVMDLFWSEKECRKWRNDPLYRCGPHSQVRHYTVSDELMRLVGSVSKLDTTEVCSRRFPLVSSIVDYAVSGSNLPAFAETYWWYPSPFEDELKRLFVKPYAEADVHRLGDFLKRQAKVFGVLLSTTVVTKSKSIADISVLWGNLSKYLDIISFSDKLMRELGIFDSVCNGDLRVLLDDVKRHFVPKVNLFYAILSKAHGSIWLELQEAERLYVSDLNAGRDFKASLSNAIKKKDEYCSTMINILDSMQKRKV